MNKALAIMHLYPDKSPLTDFEVRDDSDGKGPYIAAWNMDTSQPTEAELQAAWEAYQEAEANKPLKLTEIELLKAENAELKLALTELAEAQETDKTEVQLALAEIAGLIGGG